MKQLLFITLSCLFFVNTGADQPKAVAPEELFVTESYEAGNPVLSVTGIKHLVEKDKYKKPYGFSIFLLGNVRYRNGDQYTGFLFDGKKQGYGMLIKANGETTDGLWNSDTLMQTYHTGITAKLADNPRKSFSKKAISFMNTKFEGYSSKAGDNILFVYKKNADLFLFYGKAPGNIPEGNGHFVYVDGPDRDNYTGYDHYCGSGLFTRGEFSAGILYKGTGSSDEGFHNRYSDSKSTGNFKMLALHGFGVYHAANMYSGSIITGNFISKSLSGTSLKYNYSSPDGFFRACPPPGKEGSCDARINNATYNSFPYDKYNGDSLKFAAAEISNIKNNDRIGITRQELAAWFGRTYRETMAWRKERDERQKKEDAERKAKELALQQQREKEKTGNPATAKTTSNGQTHQYNSDLDGYNAGLIGAVYTYKNDGIDYTYYITDYNWQTRKFTGIVSYFSKGGRRHNVLHSMITTIKGIAGAQRSTMRHSYKSGSICAGCNGSGDGKQRNYYKTTTGYETDRNSKYYGEKVEKTYLVKDFYPCSKCKGKGLL